MTRKAERLRWPWLPQYQAALWVGLMLAFLTLAARADQTDFPGPLTMIPGDSARGATLLRDMNRASCLICHQIHGLDEKDQGQIGPVLNGVGDRLSAAELRQRVVDARQIDPDTVMPPYHSLKNLKDVGVAYRGKMIYSAQDVEDVVAYLLTLTTEPGQ